jgi:hypothetical protein
VLHSFKSFINTLNQEVPMRYSMYVRRLTPVVSLGLAAVVVMLVGLSAVHASPAEEVDLSIDLIAPAHVAPGSTFTVNVAYRNVGSEPAPDAWVTATLPSETEFTIATDIWGGDLPPDRIDGNTFAWNVGPVPADSGRRHILISEQVDDSLAEGTPLTNTAVISTTTDESNRSNNAASATSVVCDMAGSVKRVHAHVVMPSDVLTYTIALNMAARPGPGPQERWITLTDTLPFSHQVRFLGWTSALSGTHDGNQLQWQGRVRAGEPLTLQYRLGVEGLITPGTTITNMARFGWAGGDMGLGPVSTVVTLPHDARMFGPGGDVWSHEHGVTLTVPPGGVTDTTRFHFAPLFTATHPMTAPAGLTFAHRAFDLTAFRFRESVRQFLRPLTITVGYRDADVAGLKRETLRLWTRSGIGEPWATLGEPARVMSGSLSYTSTHLTQFALFGEPARRIYLPLIVR